jgi:CBS domain containing-hemolysin-like protein
MSVGTALILAILSVLFNAFFVATEFAIVKARASRVQELLREGARGAAAAEEVLRNLDSYLSATQLGITLASLALGWVGEPAFAGILWPIFDSVGIWSPAVVHSISLVLAFAVITFLHIVLGELTPKFFAIQRPEEVALVAAAPLRAFRRLCSPALWLLNRSASAIMRLLGIRRATDSELVHSEEELRILLTESHRTGALSASKRKLLENVFDYTHRSAKHIMVPRAEIIYLTLRKTFAENLEVIRNNQHTRYPLCETDIDHVVGMIHVKDLFQPAEGQVQVSDLLRVKRELLFVPETRPLELLQRDFQQRRIHMALVVDEYGSTSGLVTLEDILEEIVGEIQDEFDAEPPKMEASGTGYVVDGLVLIDEIAERLGLEITEPESNTLGGFVISRLGRIARVGDVVSLDAYDVKVIELKGRRVSKLLLTPIAGQERTPRSA